MSKELSVGLGILALKIAVIYVFAAILWIITTDQIVLFLDLDPRQLTLVQTYKGLFFVFVSGLFVYLLIRTPFIKKEFIKSMGRNTDAIQVQLLNRFPVPMWQADVNGRHLFSNSKWVEFTGLQLKEHEVFPWIETVHENDKPQCIRRFSEGLISKKPFSIECRVRNAEGKYIWSIITCIHDYSENSELKGITAIVNDINEKRALLEQYRGSSKKYAYLFKNNPTALIIFNDTELRILEVNDAAKILYGYREEEFLTLSIQDLYPAEELPRLKSQLASIRNEYRKSQELNQVKKDGSNFIADIQLMYLPFQKNGTYLAAVSDITVQKAALTDLIECDNRFRSIFEHSTTGEIILSEAMLILDINLIGCKMLGVEKESVINTLIYKFLAEESIHVFESSLLTKPDKAPCIGYLTMLHLDGHNFRCEWHLVKYTRMQKQYYFFTFRDIDEYYNTQKRLEESQRLISTLIAGLPGLAYRCLFDSRWTMLFVSEGVATLTGYEAEDLLGNKVISYNDIIHPPDRNIVLNTISDAIHHKTPYEIVYRIVTRDKTIKWVMELGRGVYNDHGNTIYLEGFVIDITGEREARQKLEFQTYFLKSIIDTIPFPMFYKDVQGKYILCNKSFAQYLERPMEDIIGRTIFDFLEANQAQTIHDNEQVIYKSGKGQSYETELVFPSGKKINAVFHKNIILDFDNQPSGIVGIYFDITDRVRAEQVVLEQMKVISRINAEVEQYIQTVSHDLRSPLVTIKGFLGLLEEDLAELNHVQIKEDLSRIAGATDKMHQLVEGLFEFFKSGNSGKNNEPFNLTQLAYEAKEMLSSLIDARNCQVIIQQDMPIITGDRILLREVFQNLLENAAKYTYNTPEPKIYVYSQKTDKPNEIIICVEDNGIGVTAANKEKLFNLFYKGDNLHAGAGIGLALVKKIVETHNGTIWVDSPGENMGSVFSFTLNTENLTPQTL